jgi:hypothetical protein
MIGVKFDVQTTGPVFDGTAEAEVDKFLLAAKEEIAQQGVNLVKTELSQVLKNPTGYYESRIQTDMTQRDMAVNDSGVVYGPWLAGVSSRNATTRFKGYAHWRLAMQRLQGDAVDIAEGVLPEYLKRMNA